ncbi:MAG: phosphatase PAP2 family protein [Gemmataceae bacterium]|nr:phosphatase PAP2 family protein [Gemmataceae bacterium]
MLRSRHRLACCLALAALAFSLPACAALPRVPAYPYCPDQPAPSNVVPAFQPGVPLDTIIPDDQVEASDSAGLPAWLKLSPDTWSRLCQDIDLALEDCHHYYSWRNLGGVALGVGLAAPLANTSADESIRRWYQDRARSGPADSAAEVMKYLGQAWVVAPLCMEVAGLTGHAPEDYRTDGCLFEWSNRSLRAVAVGFPPVVALYGLLGASRPDRGHSHWHPFRDFHGVSGHTFMGTVPFLTAAAMTDNPWVRYPMLLGSFLSGWSRLHQDRHYFSQVALGWWMAYLAVQCVDQTQQRRALTLTPTVTPEGCGVGIEWQY